MVHLWMCSKTNPSKTKPCKRLNCNCCNMLKMTSLKDTFGVFQHRMCPWANKCVECVSTLRKTFFFLTLHLEISRIIENHRQTHVSRHLQVCACMFLCVCTRQRRGPLIITLLYSAYSGQKLHEVPFSLTWERCQRPPWPTFQFQNSIDAGRFVPWDNNDFAWGTFLAISLGVITTQCIITSVLILQIVVYNQLLEFR